MVLQLHYQHLDFHPSSSSSRDHSNLIEITKEHRLKNSSQSLVVSQLKTRDPAGVVSAPGDYRVSTSTYRLPPST